MDTNNKKKLVIPKNVQKDMIEFFLRTSIPRKITQDIEKQKLENNPLLNKDKKED